MTHPPASTSAARHAHPWRASTVRAGVAAVVAALMLVLAGVPAFATATPSPTPTDLSGEATLTLAPAGNGIVAPGAALNAWVTIDNGTDRALAERPVVLALGRSPFADREDLAAWLSGESEADTVDEVAAAPMPAVSSGDTAQATVRLEADAAPLQNRGAGVYPLVARTAGPEGILTARSVMTVPGTAPAAVGVIVPITAGPRNTGLLTSDELAELTAADGQLTGTLDAVVGTAAILAIDPAIPAAIRALGSAAPETASQWLDRLLRLPNERFALQFGDADVAAQLLAGSPAPLQPTTLSPYMDVANFPDAAPTTSADPTPPATDTPSQPALPDLTTLVDIGPDHPNVYWPIGGTANADVVAGLAAASADGSATVTLVPSATTDAGSDAAFATASQRAADASLLVYDSAISEALRDGAVLPDAATRGAPLAAAAAHLAFAAGAPGPLLVVIDRANVYSRVGLRAAITAASSASGTPATLAQLTADPPGAVSITGVEPDADRAEAASQLFGDEATLASFASVLDDPAVLLGPERAELLQVLGAGWYSEPAAWSAAVATHRTASTGVLDGVGILPPTDTTLIASGGDLPVWVRNDLPWPVTVMLNATPDDVRLQVRTSTEVRVDALSNTRIGVPVQARRGNGEVAVSLQLQSPTDVPIGGRQQVDVNVQPDWEGVGLVILSVLLAGFIVLGLVRTVLHRRWLKRQADAA